MKNFGNVFAFTFRQYAKSKRFIALTVTVALIFFLAPAIILPVVEAASDDAPAESYDVKRVLFCDLTGGESVDISIICASTPFEHVSFTSVSTFDEATDLAKNDPESLILMLDKSDTGYSAEVLIPDGSSLTDDDAETFAQLVSAGMSTVLLIKSGLSADQLLELTKPTEVILPTDGEGDESDPIDTTRQMIAMILPIVYVMVLYFLLAFYGQGVATGVIVEKTSKLMDTFLVSVRPTEMVLGKLLSISLTGLLQFSVWVVSLALGCVTGARIVKGFSPDTDMGIIKFFDSIGEMKDIFTPAACIVAILFACLGFILYCSLAAVGGAISEKAEDLSSNNMIFAMILAISFCVTLFTNPLYTGASTTPAFLDYIPFTAILTVPCKVILGDIGIWGAIISLMITALASLLISAIAGKLYKTFALYKGKSLVSLLKRER